MPLRVKVSGLCRQDHIFAQEQFDLNLRNVLRCWRDVDDIKLAEQQIIASHRIVSVQNEDAC